MTPAAPLHQADGAPDPDPASALGGSWVEEGPHRFLTVDRPYGAGYRHGHVPVGRIHPGPAGVWPGFELLPGSGALAGGPESLLFLDLETTGLSGGAGSYAFLVGCAWFEADRLHVRQFMLSAFTAEAALLAAVDRLAARFRTLVTYNGKSFDVPLLENRFALHRMAARVTDLPHVDLLHPARRLWSDVGGEGIGCRLVSLEEELCGHVRTGDVPGFEIPGRYFDFVRSGDARPLKPVLEHNRLDLVTLAAVAARVAGLLASPDPGFSPREAFGIGRLLEAAGRYEAAAGRFAEAARAVQAGPGLRREACRRLALTCRRLRRYEESADAWEALLTMPGCPAEYVREASEALAVHHEYRRRDLPRARDLAARSLAHGHGDRARRALEHRLARLDRKLRGPLAGSLDL